jgi:3-deoxy-D-manno-octulosonate 8-phosphate phosphatase KdsC-like HAD superfamily phosphatase
MYVGNDTNDEAAMRFVGYPVAPADAHPKILELTTNITHASGGYGVVREIADWIVG